MKKIILLIIFIIISTGCSDYKELNMLSYITGIGYDYKDNMYHITYEVMDNKKNGASVETKTYTVTGIGSNTYDAHMDAATKLNKTAYYSHAQVVVMTKNILENKLLDVLDSIIRNPRLNEEFKLIVIEDSSIEDLFNSKTDAWPSVSFYLQSLITQNTYSKNIYTNMPLAIFAELISSHNKDPLVSQIKLEDKNIILDKTLLFSKDNLVGSITTFETNVFNALNDESIKISLSVNINGEQIDTATSLSNTIINIKNNELIIKTNSLSEIKKSSKNINLYKEKDLNLIQSKIEDKLTTTINILLNKLKLYKSDIFAFSNIYYINYRIDNEYLWTTFNNNINITSTISRKGIIYNVN